MKPLHERGDERVTRTQPVDDLDPMAGHVDFTTFVEEQSAALTPLEHERTHAELEQRVCVSRSGFDFLFVADHDVCMPRCGPSELTVLVRSLPQRRAPVEIEDRRPVVCREHCERRLAAW